MGKVGAKAWRELASQCAPTILYRDGDSANKAVLRPNAPGASACVSDWKWIGKVSEPVGEAGY